MQEKKQYIGTYKVVKIFRKSHKREVIKRNLTFEQAKSLVNLYPSNKNSIVVFFKQFTAEKYYI